MAYTSTTNLALQKTVEEGLWYNEAQQLQDNETANMDIIEAKFSGIANCATNATRPNISGKSVAKLWTGLPPSVTTIATIVGCITGKPFTLIKMVTNASIGIREVANFVMAGNWTKGLYDTITFVWDGEKYWEVCRSDN